MPRMMRSGDGSGRLIRRLESARKITFDYLRSDGATQTLRR